MSSRSKPCGLSREEEEELARSKKKVKDVHHASFNDGSNENELSQNQQNAWFSPKDSFKDKLVGVIPGAYAKGPKLSTSQTIWKQRTERNQMKR